MIDSQHFRLTASSQAGQNQTRAGADIGSHYHGSHQIFHPVYEGFSPGY